MWSEIKLICQVYSQYMYVISKLKKKMTITRMKILTEIYAELFQLISNIIKGETADWIYTYKVNMFVSY